MTTPGRRVSVIGFGYVGLRLAVSFGRRGPVVGFDIDRRRVAELAEGFDRTGEVDAEELSTAIVAYTTDPGDLDGADFHVVAVPTPIDDAKQPVLGHLLAASRTVGSHLGRGDIVVYESTVYPGATEEEYSLVVDIVRRLEESGVVVQVHDPLVDRAEALAHHGIRALDRQELAPGDGVVVAGAHREFADAGWEGVTTLLRGGRGIVVDVKRMLDRTAAPDGVALWRL